MDHTTDCVVVKSIIVKPLNLKFNPKKKRRLKTGDPF